MEGKECMWTLYRREALSLDLFSIFGPHIHLHFRRVTSLLNFIPLKVTFTLSFRLLDTTRSQEPRANLIRQEASKLSCGSYCGAVVIGVTE